MKKFLAAGVALLIAATVQAQTVELPNTTIKDLNSNKKIAFNEAIEKNKVTMVSFWATWCVPCKKEIKNVREKMPTWKAETDFNFVTVSIDESRAEGLVRSYAKSQGWDFPYYIDPNSDLKRSLNFQTVPFTMVIDKNGKVAYMHSGYEEGSEDEVYSKIKELSK
ncbi:MAG: disulfide oxidoreductase related to ResA [Flavipsychrobacter sp.]|jgi:thiol-disulfide isomerase/thioredoxin|nr:disulfide oxidoreductase related to ResA [Flavipsychrobacter sp.]